MNDEIYMSYSHNPPHLFRPGAAYMITAATYQKLPHIQGDTRKRLWFESLLVVIEKEQWELVGWVVLDNHYHLLMHAPEAGAERLPQLIRSLHRFTARRWNNADSTFGRRVWWNYWDTCLTHECSYYARLNYIHWNPLKHGLTSRPEDYAFSSYRAFLTEGEADIHRLEKAYPFDRIQVPDDF